MVAMAPKTSSRFSRKEGWVFVGILATAVLLRLAYLWVYAHNLPFFDYPFGDSEIYLDWAKSIAAGELLGPGVFYRAPLYAYILAGILKTAGGSLVAVYATQTLIGLATLTITCSIARRLIGRKGALASLVLAVLAGVLPFFEVKLVSTSWVVFFMMLGIWLLVLGRDVGKRWCWLLGGLAFGIGILTWPGIFLVVLAVFLFGILDREVGWYRVVIMAAGCLLAVLPVTVHNLAVGQDFVPVSSNGGFTFYQGNNRLAVGTLAHPPEVYQFQRDGRYLTGIANQERFEQEYAEETAGRVLRPSEVSGFWLGRAFGWIAKNPGDCVVLLVRKLVLALSDYESPSNYSFDLELETVWPLRLMVVRFGLFLALATIGFVVARSWRHWPAYAVIIGAFAALLLFYVSARYRVLAVPALAIIGGNGVVVLWKRIRARRGWFFLVVVGLGVFFVARLGFVLPLRRGSALLLANGYRNLGEVYHYRVREPERAKKAYQRAVEIYQLNINPSCLQERLALSETRRLLQRLGTERVRKPEQDAEAAELVQQAEQALAHGDSVAARSQLERALAADSGMRSVYLLLGSILGARGEEKQAQELFSAGTRRFPDDPVILYNFAYAALSAGDYDTALIAAQRVLAIVPNHPWAEKVAERARRKLIEE